MEIYLFPTMAEAYDHTSMISAISYVFGKGRKERNYVEIYGRSTAHSAANHYSSL
jgi:hypothetical protein